MNYQFLADHKFFLEIFIFFQRLYMKPRKTKVYF